MSCEEEGAVADGDDLKRGREGAILRTGPLRGGRGSRAQRVRLAQAPRLQISWAHGHVVVIIRTESGGLSGGQCRARARVAADVIAKHLVLCGQAPPSVLPCHPLWAPGGRAPRGVRTHPRAARLQQVAAWLGGCFRPGQPGSGSSLSPLCGHHCAATEQAAFREARPTKRLSCKAPGALFASREAAWPSPPA